MTRFLLVFTLLTLAVSITTEQDAQSDGTNSAPDPNGPQPIQPKTKVYSIQREPGNQTSLRIKTATGHKIQVYHGNIPPPWISLSDKKMEEFDDIKQANLKKCNDGAKPPMCFVGGNCVIYTPKDEKHTNIRMVNRTSMLGWASLRKKIEKCDVGATFSFKEAGMFEFEYHTSRDYFHLPLIVEINKKDRHFNIIGGKLHCSPYKTCKIMNSTRTNAWSDYYWNGTVTFYTFTNRAELTNCYTHWNTTCYFGSACLDGDSEGVHEKSLVVQRQHNLVKLTPVQRKAAMNCNVGVVLKPKPDGGYDMEYHSTPENTHLTFTTFSKHPEGRIYRELSIQDGEIQCRPNCRFTRNKNDSNKYFWSGEYRLFSFANQSEEDYYMRHGGMKSQYEKDLDAMTPDQQKRGEEAEIVKEEQNIEPSTNLAMVLGVCAAAFVVCIATAVVAVKVMEHRQKAKNERQREMLEVKYNQIEAANNRSGPTVSPPTEQDYCMALRPMGGPEPDNESERNKSGRYDP